MAAMPADQFAEVQMVLGEIVAEHGPSALSNPARMSNLLQDLLPEAPGLARMLVVAAEDRVADELRDHVASGLDGATAARLVASSFARRTLFAAEACAGVVGAIALVLGIAIEAGYSPTVVPSPSGSDLPATAHRGQARPPVERPELALQSQVIDFGQIAQHGPAPERRVKIGNAGGGSLNARAATPDSWILIRRTGDELIISADTSVAGEHQGSVTIDSDGGSAAIRVRAAIQAAQQPDRDRPAAAPSASGEVDLRIAREQPTPPRPAPGQEHWPWPWAPNARRRPAQPR